MADRKVCNCRKSQCLKLYCDCFNAGLFCVAGSCRCIDCHNNSSHESQRNLAIVGVLERRPGAFQSKVQATGGDEPSHQTGCKCSRSRCIKKYCECFREGVTCTSVCRCSNCCNYKGSRELARARAEDAENQADPPEALTDPPARHAAAPDLALPGVSARAGRAGDLAPRRSPDRRRESSMILAASRASVRPRMLEDPIPCEPALPTLRNQAASGRPGGKLIGHRMNSALSAVMEPDGLRRAIQAVEARPDRQSTDAALAAPTPLTTPDISASATQSTVSSLDEQDSSPAEPASSSASASSEVSSESTERAILTTLRDTLVQWGRSASHVLEESVRTRAAARRDDRLARRAQFLVRLERARVRAIAKAAAAARQRAAAEAAAATDSAQGMIAHRDDDDVDVDDDDDATDDLASDDSRGGVEEEADEDSAQSDDADMSHNGDESQGKRIRRETWEPIVAGGDIQATDAQQRMHDAAEALLLATRG